VNLSVFFCSSEVKLEKKEDKSGLFSVVLLPSSYATSLFFSFNIKTSLVQKKEGKSKEGLA